MGMHEQELPRAVARGAMSALASNEPPVGTTRHHCWCCGAFAMLTKPNKRGHLYSYCKACWTCTQFRPWHEKKVRDWIEKSLAIGEAGPSPTGWLAPSRFGDALAATESQGDGTP